MNKKNRKRIPSYYYIDILVFIFFSKADYLDRLLLRTTRNFPFFFFSLSQSLLFRYLIKRKNIACSQVSIFFSLSLSLFSFSSLLHLLFDFFSIYTSLLNKYLINYIFTKKNRRKKILTVIFLFFFLPTSAIFVTLFFFLLSIQSNLFSLSFSFLCVIQISIKS